MSISHFVELLDKFRAGAKMMEHPWDRPENLPYFRVPQFRYMIHVKTDTKEKFTVICLAEPRIPVNMAEEWDNLLLPYLDKPVPHIVLNLSELEEMAPDSGERLAGIQQQFYERNCSMVICCLKPGVEKMLDEQGLLEQMNVTPTESEAWDIVQMEEIERELMEGFDQ